MTELFRYIQQAFALPSGTGAIDVATQSDFQTSLRSAIGPQESPEQIRGIADRFLSEHFPTAEAKPFRFADQLVPFSRQLLGLKHPSREAVNQLVESVFASNARALVTSADFLKDKELLNDTLVSVKLVTGFDRVPANDLVTMRQAVAYLEDLADGRVADFTAKGVRSALQRPIRISKVFVDALNARPNVPPPSESQPGTHLPASLVAEQQALQSVYATIMALQPREFELKTSTIRARQVVATVRGEAEPASGRKITRHAAEVASSQLAHAAAALDLAAAEPTFLAVPPAALERLGRGAQRILENNAIDVTNAPVTDVIASIKRRWLEVSSQLAPYQVPAPSRVFRVGVHLLAVRDASAVPLAEEISSNATVFRPAITRPVGIGDLQVVRQELTGYEPGEISHIENVLEGELLRRSTRREEVNELTTTQETDTTQVEERDQQSTSRNELSTETQKEASQQTTSAKDQTTTINYGKLVENSKTNYARSVTDRAVSTLTQMVKQQRVQREKKTFTETAMHELDNRDKPKKVRGIYQWVDKKYRTRIFNYGKRLLYDVVVPEPAAFLIDSLKSAAQWEDLQLTKPADPQITPRDLNSSNYMDYAARYGVTGSVAPPPDDFIQTVAHTDSQKAGNEQIKAYGKDVVTVNFSAFTIRIPDNYKALSGYVQMTNPHANVAPGTNPPEPNFFGKDKQRFEFFIGESHFLSFSQAGITTLNQSFKMEGETGDIPVTFHNFPEIFQFNYAIGINCQRTDKSYEQWQLKTHAAIMAGYQRQLADYQDKLARYQSAVRSQMALAQNYTRDPSIEQEELKKAFIFLLLGEHFWQAFHPTPNPKVVPPNPTDIKSWGAMVAFFERAFEWENMMYVYYPYFWGRRARWDELILIQDIDPQFEAFLKAGAARIVIPVRPGFEGALAHYQETGDIWMGEEMPDMFSEFYVSIIEEIKARNFAPGEEILVSEWDVKLPTTLVMLKEDETMPEWKPSAISPATP